MASQKPDGLAWSILYLQTSTCLWSLHRLGAVLVLQSLQAEVCGFLIVNRLVRNPSSCCPNFHNLYPEWPLPLSLASLILLSCCGPRSGPCLRSSQPASPLEEHGRTGGGSSGHQDRHRLRGRPEGRSYKRPPSHGECAGAGPRRGWEKDLRQTRAAVW